MKDKNFKIKIWDLLCNIWSFDEIHFEKKFLDELIWLDDNGISWDIYLQSLNDQAIHCILKNISCSVIEDCEVCNKTYNREIIIPQYSAKFVLWDTKTYITKKSDEEVFQINSKDEFINLYDMVLQAVFLQEPIAKHCGDCQKKVDALNDDEELEYFESNSNITFKL